jgi:hypothetical protein
MATHTLRLPGLLCVSLPRHIQADRHAYITADPAGRHEHKSQVEVPWLVQHKFELDLLANLLLGSSPFNLCTVHDRFICISCHRYHCACIATAACQALNLQYICPPHVK